MDADGVFLAFDEEIYNVTFYRDGTQTRTSDYVALTQSINDTIDIIEKNGNELSASFEIRKNEITSDWEFNFGELGGGVTEKTLETREKQWRSNHYLSTTKYPTAADALDALKRTYQIPETMGEERMLQVMAVYSKMQMNLYASQAVVIAKEVPYETVLEIETKSMLLPGVEIELGTKRVYPKHQMAAQVIGYTGMMTSEAWKRYEQNGYAYNDYFGVTGVEAFMEDWLTQNSSMRKGYSVVERNILGKITRVIETQDPKDGNNVKLTLNSSYQQRAEEAIAQGVAEIRTVQNKKQVEHKWRENNREQLESGIRNWDTAPLKLADTGCMVVVDMEGRVLAMANYPTFDLNAMIKAGEESAAITQDPRGIMSNYAIQNRGAPGSIFKLVTGFAALQEGVLTVDDTITDEGRFIKHMVSQETESAQYIDYSKAPKCWISSGNRYKHKDLNIVGGIANSCNYFFYEIGFRLYENGDKLGKYASLFGLTSTTGLELPNEIRSVMASQNALYDPSSPVGEMYQDSSKAIIVYNTIVGKLREIGVSTNVTYEEDRMQTCTLRLMKMAEQTPQSEWDTPIRTILMEELNMTREQVMLQAVFTDIYLALNDMKWGGGEAIMAAIGQSVSAVTPAGAARYMMAVANGGNLYNLTIVDSVINPDGEVISQRTPQLIDHIEGAENYLPYIREGTRRVVDDGGTAESYFSRWEHLDQFAGKTGTAQNSRVDLENHAWFIAFMPFDNPQIAVSVFVKHGYSGSRAAYAAKLFSAWWFDSQESR
ncbi:MAG: hypothetical protein GX786_05530, partial [Clostridiales bacterium]|nr:hypothetical protein [Clostridiales bacterium]